MPEVEREKRLAKGMAYTFLEVFIFEGHDLLPEYELHRPEGAILCSHYLVDFHDSILVSCKDIVRGVAPAPGVKKLQLSSGSRGELREKMAHYYARIPDEDGG